MDRQNQQSSGRSPQAPFEDRLDSWKEIAAYLKRDVRTLRRWEKNEGLPVHRHMHEKLPTVYAYKSELDAWWNNRKPKLETQEAKEAREAPFDYAQGKQEAKGKSKRWVVAGVVAAAMVVAAGAAYWWSRASALPFAERDWVLIGQFENRTGEEVFDGTLEYALKRELSNSRFVNVVPRERINDTLQLMKKPLGTPLTGSVGREVAVRDGGVRALLTGRVEKLDTTYLLSANLVNPASGVTVASFSEEGEGQKEVVDAIHRLANRVREWLGEELASIEESEQKLAKVSTPSLRALQLFSQADAVIAFEDDALAEELLRQAVAEDPEFASGYMHLAYAIHNQGRPAEEYLPYAEKALALSDQATERERYFILGSYYEMTGEEEKAAAAYEALLRRYPDHFWALGKKEGRLAREGHYVEAAHIEARQVKLRPNSFRTNFFAATQFARWGEQPFEGQGYVERMRELVSAEEAREFAMALTWLELYEAREHWLAGELEKALQEATRLSQQLNRRTGQERERLAYNLFNFYLSLGRLETAEELALKGDDRLALALARDDRQALVGSLRQEMGRGEEAVGPVETILFARLGMLPEAEKALAMVEDRDFTAPWLRNPGKQKLTEGFRKVARGEVARARGATAEALALLEEGFEKIPPHGFHTYFLAAESLAETYEEQGHRRKAMDVLERAAEERRRAVYYSGLSTLLWMRIQLRLAELYARQGREEQARGMEAELRRLLGLADRDHPILRQLQQADAVTVAAAQQADQR